MHKRNRFAKKPKILKHKVKLANIIKAKWKRKCYSEHPHKYYWWRGEFYSEDGIHIYIYYQNYVTIRKGVDYVHLRFNDIDGRALTPTEVKDLLSKLDND